MTARIIDGKARAARATAEIAQGVAARVAAYDLRPLGHVRAAFPGRFLRVDRRRLPDHRVADRRVLPSRAQGEGAPIHHPDVPLGGCAVRDGYYVLLHGHPERWLPVESCGRDQPEHADEFDDAKDRPGFPR